MTKFRSTSIVHGLMLAAAMLIHGQVSRAAENVDYLTQIKPLLKGRCYACHGALKQEGGLRLDTAVSINRGGDSGSSTQRDEPSAPSLLVERISDPDPASRMPPEFEGEPLSAAQVDLIKRWIDAGAPAPEHEEAETDPADHWSFQPVKRHELPTVQNSAWVRNPIDSWIAKGHEDHDLEPQHPASRLTLLRRLYVDLIGLPPTAEDIAACLAAPADDWYEETVDKLLKDPRHGERWARHWMDNWRYSDWWGLNAQLRNSQRHMWHWRDWIVESLNDDTPYDEMLRLMLAADEIAPGDPDKLRATGFLARNYYIFNRVTWLDQTVEHVGKGLLGLTMNCAKCHDHKFDPIWHTDYYSMRAFFEPYQVRLDMVPGEVDVVKDGIPRVFDAFLDKPTYLFVRGDESQPDKSKAIAPGIPELLQFKPLDIQSIDLPPKSWQPERQPWVFENYLSAARAKLKSSETALKKSEKALEDAKSVSAGMPSAAASDSSLQFTSIDEDFATFDDARWKIVSGDWSHEPGVVRQSLQVQQRSVLQLNSPVPRNFDATIRYRLTGGSTWRSVGIAFDAAPGSNPTNLIYASGHDTDSKIQASYDVNGKSNYPANGKRRADIRFNTDYEFRVQVRDTLVNVSLNGEPMLAWRSPLTRRDGAIQLTTYDALASISAFKLSALPDDVTLREPTDSPATPQDLVAAAEAELRKARDQYAVADAELRSLEARIEALQVEWANSDESAARAAAIKAVKAERKLAVAKAEQSLTAAQLAADLAPKNKQADADKKLTAATKELNKAKDLLVADVKDSETFTPLAGAKWSATRFEFTGRDDPTVDFPAQSTGRRKALAEWVTDRNNPLTARVAVNHIWTRHFGQPLVASTFDFGRNGATPTHPELLDYLAAELMDSGWSMKHIHRLIVLSSTYRMSSSAATDDPRLAKDPDNKFWWRRVPIRLESQVVRDSILATAGTLDETMGGPSVPIKEQDKSRRRSLYFFHSNNEKNLLLTMFDEASVTECYQREQSVVPQQALALSNSALVLESSQQIAEQIADKHPDDEAFIRQAFLLLTGFEAGSEEITRCQAALHAWEKLPDTSPKDAQSNLIWALINHNDFVTLR